MTDFPSSSVPSSSVLSSLFARTLVLAPHPDDEVLGAGGLITRLCALGCLVHVTYVTMYMDCQRDEIPAALATLASKTHPSWDHLYSYDSGRWTQNSHHDLVGQIEAGLATFTPSAVLLPSPHSGHQDHWRTAVDSFAALRPSAGTSRWRSPLVLEYEAAADVWALGLAPPLSFSVSLSSAQVDAKCIAMGCYTSQRRDPPSERSSKAIRALAELRGCQAGVDFAEAFRVLRWLAA